MANGEPTERGRAGGPGLDPGPGVHAAPGLGRGGRDERAGLRGCGITAPDLGYEDYAGLNAQGQIVLVMGGDPGSRDPQSPFRRPEAYHYSERNHKLINARKHGARGILVVTRPMADKDEVFPNLAGISQDWSILAAFITRIVADGLLAPSGQRLAEFAAAIDRSSMPQSFALPGVTLRLEIDLLREHGTEANIVGVPVTIPP